jgi:hypothetical protein
MGDSLGPKGSSIGSSLIATAGPCTVNLPDIFHSFRAGILTATIYSAMSHEDDAELQRFQAFVELPDQDARDQVAYAEFAGMIHGAAQCAMSNAQEGGDHAAREFEEMHRAMTELLFGLVARIPLAAVLANADGIGYAIRYGLVEPRKGALDHVQTPAQLEELAERGHAADRAEIDRRMDEIESRKP